MKKSKLIISHTFAIIVGIVISIAGIYISTAISSSEILYDNTNSKIGATTLQGAIDILYDSAKINCPDNKICIDKENFDNNVTVTKGTGSNIGDIICIGNECFYVIDYNTSIGEVQMLAKYNLYVGNICTSDNNSSCTAIPNNEVTNKQDSRAIGWDSSKGGYSSTATTEFGTSTTYSTSTVKTYVDNYVD